MKRTDYSKTVLLIAKDEDDFYSSISTLLSTSFNCRIVKSSDLVHEADFSVVLGGDGTVLAAARAGLKSPVIVINTGHLGFLTSADKSNFNEVLFDFDDWYFSEDFNRPTAPECTLTTRHMLDIKVGNDSYFALNDIAIKNFSKLARVSVFAVINKQEEIISEYRADGLIVATPTGSTAYSLSASGPIIHPSCKSYVITPICPQGLTQRPLVIPADWHLRIQLEDEMNVSIDGQIARDTPKGTSIEVRYNSHAIETLNPSHSYFEVLRDKLGWGIKPV